MVRNKKSNIIQDQKNHGQTYTGYGFDGQVASNKVRDLYINKSVAHKKKRGASNPIIYNL